MERLTSKIKQLNILFGTHLDDADNLVFDCICGFVYDGDNLTSGSIALQSVSSDSLSARRYVKDCMLSLYFVYPNIPIEVSMTISFTNEYFDDLKTFF